MKKSIYRLHMPRGITDPLFNDYVDVPLSSDGLKLAEWWSSATFESRVKVATEGNKTGDYVAAFKKIASEVMEPVTDKSRHDLKDVIRSLEKAHEDRGDPSTFSEPPITNP